MPTMSKKAKQMIFIVKRPSLNNTLLGDTADMVVGNIANAADAVSILAMLNEQTAEQELQEATSQSHGALSATIADLRTELEQADKDRSYYFNQAEEAHKLANELRTKLSDATREAANATSSREYWKDEYVKADKRADELGAKTNSNSILLDLLVAGKVWLDYTQDGQATRVGFLGKAIETNDAKELTIYGTCELPNVAWNRTFTSAQIIDWKPYTD